MQTPGLSRCQAHISVWIVLLSALTIIPRFLCFYVVSPTNGIASCDTCETSAQTTLGWMGKPAIGFEPMSDGYKPPALPIELCRHAFLENSPTRFYALRRPYILRNASLRRRTIAITCFVLSAERKFFPRHRCETYPRLWKIAGNRHAKAGFLSCAWQVGNRDGGN